jgi:tRNA(adenine34) deaminase
VCAEPCAYCCYAIRESRIPRVVYGLRNPHMGGVSKWNVLTDEDLSDTIPEVFDPPPEIIAGFMAHEVEQALLRWNPLVWGVVKRRGIFVAGPLESMRASDGSRAAVLKRGLLAFLRRTVIDRFGRSK